MITDPRLGEALLSRVARQNGLMTTADVAEYLGQTVAEVGHRRGLGLGHKPFRIGGRVANWYRFDPSPEWRAAWFEGTPGGAPKSVHVEALLHIRRIVDKTAIESGYGSKERARAILSIIDTALGDGLGSRFTAAELQHARLP